MVVGVVKSQGATKVDWTPELIQSLRLMAAGGMSSAMMAFVMGAPLTKGAIIGKFSRMGFPLGNPSGGQFKHIKKAWAALRTVPVVAAPMAEQPQAPPEPEFPQVVMSAWRIDPWEGAAAAVDTLKYSECKWPFGDPKGDEFRFCCAPQTLGSAYCKKHAERGCGAGTYAERKAASGLNRRIA